MSEDATNTTEPVADAKPEPLGEGGLRALQAERQRAADAERSLKAFTDLGKSPDDLRSILDEHAKTDLDAAIAQARQEARVEAQERLHKTLRSVAVREAAMKAGFHDPDLAVVLIGDEIDKIAVSDSDEVDAAAADAAVAQIAETRHYLIKSVPEPSSPNYRDAGIGGSSGPLPLNGDGIENAVKKKLGIA